MSNNYNSTLQLNNTDLQAILNTINELPEAGGGDPVLQDKTVTPTTSQQTVTADSGYDGLDTVTVNAMPPATQATPSITVDSSGLITATATQTAGYVTAGTRNVTKQLTVQTKQTITPGTSNKTIASGRYLVGTQTIKGDSNLVAGNIKKGVSIFGVAGSYEGSGGGNEDIGTWVIDVEDATSYGLGNQGNGTLDIVYLTVDDSGALTWASDELERESSMHLNVVPYSFITISQTISNSCQNIDAIETISSPLITLGKGCATIGINYKYEWIQVTQTV